MKNECFCGSTACKSQNLRISEYESVPKTFLSSELFFDLDNSKLKECSYWEKL